MKTCVPIDESILADRNIVQKEADKKFKCRSLLAEIQRMWNIRCVIIPVIIGATGFVAKGLKKDLEPYRETVRYIHCKRQLYLEQHTRYGNCMTERW